MSGSAEIGIRINAMIPASVSAMNKTMGGTGFLMAQADMLRKLMRS